CVGGSCAGDALADYDGASEPAAGTSAFGTQLLATGGIADATWSSQPAVAGLHDSASVACTTPGIGPGTCSFTWGATAAPSDTPGAYQALARMVVLAN